MTRRQFWYDRDGNPITIEEAERLLSSDLLRRVAVSEISDNYAVSTVHTVLDQGLGIVGVEPPLIFETAVFKRGDGLIHTYRSPNEVAARAAHDRAVAWVKNGAPPDDEP